MYSVHGIMSKHIAKDLIDHDDAYAIESVDENQSDGRTIRNKSIEMVRKPHIVCSNQSPSFWRASNYTVNLDAFIEDRKSRPIFTRGLLQHVSRIRMEIEASPGGKGLIWMFDLAGIARVIYRPPVQQNHDQLHRIRLSYLSYVELSPEYTPWLSPIHCNNEIYLVPEDKCEEAGSIFGQIDSGSDKSVDDGSESEGQAEDGEKDAQTDRRPRSPIIVLCGDRYAKEYEVSVRRATLYTGMIHLNDGWPFPENRSLASSALASDNDSDMGNAPRIHNRIYNGDNFGKGNTNDKTKYTDNDHPPFNCELAVGTWRRQSKYSRKVSALHLINHHHKSHFHEHLPCPVFFDAFRIKPFAIDMGDKYMTKELQEIQNTITQIKKLWLVSDSCGRLKRTLLDVACKTSQITKIVGFGIGSLHWKSAIIQYFTILTIVETLEVAYRLRNPLSPAIELVFQDPYYDARDKLLFRYIFPRQVRIVDDPQGFLELDRNSLVVTCHLPIDVPLLQIIADMFWEDRKNGPAGFICDRDYQRKRERYCIRDRSSPRVLEFLEDYCCDDFDDHQVERELSDALEMHRSYWLWDVYCFWRPQTQERSID